MLPPEERRQHLRRLDDILELLEQMNLNEQTALGEVLASGFRALNSDPRCTEVDLRSAMETTGREVAHRLEKYLSALATIASAMLRLIWVW